MVGEGLQALDCAAEVVVVQRDVVLALLSKIMKEYCLRKLLITSSCHTNLVIHKGRFAVTIITPSGIAATAATRPTLAAAAAAAAVPRHLQSGPHWQPLTHRLASALQAAPPAHHQMATASTSP